MVSINDLKAAYYGGDNINDSEYSTLKAAYDGGVTANSLLAWGGNVVTDGVESIPRELAVSSAAMSTQVMRLTFFVCRKTFTAASLATYTGGTAAGATPTVCRMGLYTVATDGALTLVASTTNDTGLWAATTTLYSKAITGPSGITSYGMVAGQRYAFGALIVTAAATPTLVGWQTPAGAVANIEPKIGSAVTGQADLPASVASGGFSATQAAFPMGLILP